MVCFPLLTSAPSWGDGCTVVLQVQGTGRVQHRVHKDVGLALLQHGQDLLQRKGEKKEEEVSVTHIK